MSEFKAQNVKPGQIVYITKYALSKGIEQRTVANSFNPAELWGNVVKVNGESGRYAENFFRRNEWHKTFEEAKQRVLEMIAAERKSIENKLAKLDQLEASLKEGE